MLDEEILSFHEEEEAGESPQERSPLPGWKILVVDDDSDVHEATELALRNTLILGRPLVFLHAFTAVEALHILSGAPDIAVILLDVVMETEDAGLRTISTIREKMRMTNVRIILRTGQPGHAPEIETISRYDINDYKTKSDLTRNKLFTTLTTAIRSYDQLKMLETSRQGLERIVASSNQFIAEQGLHRFAGGVITQIAGLLGIKPEGVVCVCEESSAKPDPCYRIIAAAGQYECLVRHKLEEIQDTRIVESLTLCLQEHRNQIKEDSIALYFHQRNGPLFAAYIDSPHPLSAVDMHLLEVFCTNIALCAENVQLVARLRQQAYEDLLVGLPNRLAFIEAINQRLTDTADADVVIALIDIDQFAGINDMLGHQYGDQLLKGIARHLRDHLPEDCLIARVGGDVFGILGSARLLSPARLHPIFAAPLLVGDAEHAVTISIGLVDLRPGEGNGSDYLKDAHMALKRAKTGGLSQSAYYTHEIGTETRERARLLQNLRSAFDHRSLFLMYQPQVDLVTREPIAFEALLRWQLDDTIFVAPDRFIPVAEHSGLIIPLGAWVLRTAMHSLRQINAMSKKPLRMAVNVSVVQLRQESFLHLLDDALSDTGIDPSLLELEVTESCALLGMEQARILLGEIRKRGVKVAIDDFGTGYSSLSYIDQLPVDRLKIDRAFISPLDSPQQGARIVELVIPMSHRLGMKVIAEGVENEAQLAALQALGCDEGQGFLFARPMPIKEALTWLAASTYQS